MVVRSRNNRPMMPRTTIRGIVIARDRRCVASKLDRSHQCRDKWGTPHDPRETRHLTLEHVHDPRGTRHDDPSWCVANCHGANVVEHHESKYRSEYWAYLEGVRAGLGMAD